TTDAQLMPGKPLGVGAVFKQGMKGPGGRIDADYEIVECNPNEWIKFQVVAGPARPTGTYKFESDGKSTKVTFVLDFQPKGLARLMDGMISKNMRAEVGNLSNLKSYLEAH
ncbi:MAG TPA: SRPBCC family protein, partial [Anaerolineae bacterium]|nr:SRPBCC family protein [Anaerolineae bacterium]